MPELVVKPDNRQLAFDEIRLSVYADRILNGLEQLSKETLLRGVQSSFAGARSAERKSAAPSP